jgi:putative ABC transport system permease protein
MTFTGLFEDAMSTLRLNMLRTTLTATGVIIGVAGVIVLGAANGGASKAIEQQLTVFGSNVIDAFVIRQDPAIQRGPVVVMTDEDATALFDQVPGISHMSREVWNNITLVSGNTSWVTQYWGVDAAYADVFDVKTSEGRFFDEDEVHSGARVAVLGATVAKELFGGESPLGRHLRMGSVPVQVIGVRTKLGSVGGEDMDNFIIVPVTTARARLPQEGRVSGHQIITVHLKALPGANLRATEAIVRSLLRERKHIKDGDEDPFDIGDSNTYVEGMNATHATLSTLLAASTAISLLVGGVGIMNIMLVSVTERTHEIGLRMAIGARKRDILAQFLTEAIVLCVVAGFAGLAFGVTGSYFVAKSSGWPLIVSPQTVALALAAAAGTGVLFGYLPAHRAAALNPIDALRRE